MSEQKTVGLRTGKGLRIKKPLGDMSSEADRLGSYTGVPTEGEEETPTQDADDL